MSLTLTAGGRRYRPLGGAAPVDRIGDVCTWCCARDLDAAPRLQHAADRAERGRRRIHRHGLAERSDVRKLQGDLDREDYWYLEHFWHQFGNSIYIGFATMVLTVLIGSLASFAMGRMRLRKAWLIGNFSLITYAVPASFLVIPFTRLMRVYGLTDNLWSVIAAEVTFATPYAILILHQYGKLIPLELDDAARVDGATPLQVYLRIYLPLMAPALAAVATYALLLAWNEYLYQYLLLSRAQHDGGGGDRPVLRQR